MKYINWTISIYKICTFSVFVNSCRNAKIFASIYIPFTFNFFNQNRGFKIILVIFLQIHVLLNEICRVGTLIRMFSKISMGSNSILSVSVIFFLSATQVTTCLFWLHHKITRFFFLETVLLFLTHHFTTRSALLNLYFSHKTFL